jgi:hypothetical protein
MRACYSPLQQLAPGSIDENGTAERTPAGINRQRRAPPLALGEVHRAKKTAGRA